MNQIMAWNQINQYPKVIKIEIEISSPYRSGHIYFSMTMNPIEPFNYFIDLVKNRVLAFLQIYHCRDDYVCYCYSDFTNSIMNDNETKSLEELGFKDGSKLFIHFIDKVYTWYKFTIHPLELDKGIFHFDLRFCLKGSSEEFDSEVKRKIFEISGLKAKEDYHDQLTFQIKQYFRIKDSVHTSPLQQLIDSHPIMVDVILEPIIRRL